MLTLVSDVDTSRFFTIDTIIMFKIMNQTKLADTLRPRAGDK